MRLTFHIILLFASFVSLLPLKYLALGVVLWPIATQVQQMARSTTSMACGLGLVPNLLCQFIASAGDSTVLFTSAVQTEFSALEGLLYNTSEVTLLVSALMESRLSVSDLAIVVRASPLSSSTVLAEELTAISTETKEASRNLQKLLAQVQGTVDMYVCFHHYSGSPLADEIGKHAGSQRILA